MCGEEEKDASTLSRLVRGLRLPEGKLHRATEREVLRDRHQSFQSGTFLSLAACCLSLTGTTEHM